MKIWVKDKHGKYQRLPPGINADLLTRFDDGEIGIPVDERYVGDAHKKPYPYWPSTEHFDAWVKYNPWFEDRTGKDENRVILRFKK